jgi:hypothetical protein
MKTSDFKQEDELKKMKVADIKKHIREFNEHYAIKGYSKLKKDQLINAVLTAQMRISKSSTAKPVEKKQTPLTVTKADGTVKELKKKAPKKEADTSDLKLLKSKIEEILPIFTEISPNKYDVKQRSKIVTLINRMRRLSQNVGKNKDVDNLLKLFNKLLAEDKNKKPILTDYTAMYNALDNVLKKIENKPPKKKATAPVKGKTDKDKIKKLLSYFKEQDDGSGGVFYEIFGAGDFIKDLSGIKSRAKDIVELKRLVKKNTFKDPVGTSKGVKGKFEEDWFYDLMNTNEIYKKLLEISKK